MNAEDLVEKVEKELEKEDFKEGSDKRKLVFEILIELNIMEKKYLIAFQLLIQIKSEKVFPFLKTQQYDFDFDSFLHPLV